MISCHHTPCSTLRWSRRTRRSSPAATSASASSTSSRSRRRTSRRSSGCYRSRRPDASHQRAARLLPILAQVRGSESPRTRRAVLPQTRSARQDSPLAPYNPSTTWLAASAEFPGSTPQELRVGAARTSQGGHVPGSYSAPRARALLASQRAAPQLIPTLHYS